MRNMMARLLGLILLLGSFTTGWLILDYRDFLNTPLTVPEKQPVVFVIQPGESLTTVSRRLAAHGIVEHPAYFHFLGRWKGWQARIKAGEYEIEPGMLPEQLLIRFVRGKVRLLSFTIVEGWTWRRLRDELRRSSVLRHTIDDLDQASLMRRLGMPGQHPEGRFLPETYRFPRGTTDIEFLRRASAAMREYLARAWARRAPDLPLKNPYEALILASIVERETAVPAERRQIAGVFIRRLRKGMRLQTDPTVIYGMGKRFDGNLRRRDLTHDTPYNTYTRHGLPPTPIAMPGKAAIDAVLHPAPGKSLYFVARGDGTHHFSATLEEHNRAVIKYQLGGKRRPFSSMPARKEKRKP